MDEFIDLQLVVCFFLFYSYSMYCKLRNQQFVNFANLLRRQDEENQAVLQAFCGGNYRAQYDGGRIVVAAKKKVRRRPRFWMSLQSVSVVFVFLAMIIYVIRLTGRFINSLLSLKFVCYKKYILLLLLLFIIINHKKYMHTVTIVVILYLLLCFIYVILYNV